MLNTWGICALYNTGVFVYVHASVRVWIRMHFHACVFVCACVRALIYLPVSLAENVYTVLLTTLASSIKLSSVQTVPIVFSSVKSAFSPDLSIPFHSSWLPYLNTHAHWNGKVWTDQKALKTLILEMILISKLSSLDGSGQD